jgi:N-acetylneuraminate synthase/N,N'-diacetyllegionaminate synthase
MQQRVRIQGKEIGTQAPVFLVAEVGINHNGSLSLAEEMIAAAKEAGADAVKFQFYKTESFISKRYAAEQYKLFKSYQLTLEQQLHLLEYGRKKDIIVFASVFDKETATALAKAGMSCFKIASGDITYIDLIQHVAKFQRPLIISTGAANLAEIQEAVMAASSIRDKLILMHCVSIYPASLEQLNLRAIEVLKKRFGTIVGFSDHTMGMLASLLAIALGAVLLERHFTIDPSLPGPDQKISLTPSAFQKLVRDVRSAEKALGLPLKEPLSAEEKVRTEGRRSLFAKRRIPAGTKIVEEMLQVKRPAKGLLPKYMKEVCGRVSLVDIEEDEVLEVGKVGHEWA